MRQFLCNILLALLVSKTKRPDLRKLIMTFQDLTDAINAQTAAVTALTTAIDAAVIKLGTIPTDAQITDLTQKVTATTGAVAAGTVALNTALGVTSPPV